MIEQCTFTPAPMHPARMKNVAQLFLISIAAIGNAQEQQFQFSKMAQFTPTDVGAFHSDAFRRLENIYGKKSSDKKTVKTRHDDFSDVISSYCDKGSEVLCKLGMKWAKDRIERHIAQSDHHSISKTGHFPVTYPKGMHSDLEYSLDNIFRTLDLLDLHNLEEITDTISKIEEEIEAMDHVDPAHKKMTLSATSVAIESTKMWHGVYYDENHPLRANDSSYRRRQLAITGGDKEPQQSRRLQWEATITGFGDFYQNLVSLLYDFGGLFTVCNNGLAFIISADIAGVLLTPVSVFAGIPTAYIGWIMGIGVYMFSMIQIADTTTELLTSFGFYIVMPFFIPFLMLGLPTTFLSYSSFSALEDCVFDTEKQPSDDDEEDKGRRTQGVKT